MAMLRADKAEVFWDDQKKQWVVRIQVGAEVIRRGCKTSKRESEDAALKTMAVETARDEGYELPAEAVDVKR
jgi:hypothetical protein